MLRRRRCGRLRRRLVIVAHVLQQVGPDFTSVRAMRAQAPGLFATLILQVAFQRAPPLVRAATLRTLVSHGRRRVTIDGRARDGKHEVYRKIQQKSQHYQQPTDIGLMDRRSVLGLAGPKTINGREIVVGHTEKFWKSSSSPCIDSSKNARDYYWFRPTVG